YVGHTAADVCGTQGQSGVHGTVEVERAHRTSVPAAGTGLVLFDESHRPGLGGSGDGDRPHVGEEGVQGVEFGEQGALDVVDGVDEAGVHLDLTSSDDLDAAGFAHAGLVVAVHIGAYGQFGLLPPRGE